MSTASTYHICCSKCRRSSSSAIRLLVRIVRCDDSQRRHIDKFRSLTHNPLTFSLADLTPKAAVLGQLLKFSVKKLFGKVQQTRRPVEPGVAA